MSGTLDDQYFEWLYRLIGSVRNRNPARSYWLFARHLYMKEFVWFVPNDQNRAEDGRELRYEFLAEKKIENPDPEWMAMGCSFLEMFVAISYRLEFEVELPAGEWFWILMRNLDLVGITDKKFTQRSAQKIDRVLTTVNDRTYDSLGRGGLFPLHDSPKDQRKVELWYQMAEYLAENYPV